jgi:hypothetical protein
MLRSETSVVSGVVPEGLSRHILSFTLPGP